MQKVKVVNRMKIESESDGAERQTELTNVVPALAAKHGSVCVQVHEADSDTRISIGGKHSPEPVAGWANMSDLFDSGGSTGIATGMHSADASDVTNVDQLLLVPKIQKTDAGSGGKSAVISVWLILKPF